MNKNALGEILFSISPKGFIQPYKIDGLCSVLAINIRLVGVRHLAALLNI